MKKAKILLVGPYETKGRYKGGISYIVNSIIEKSDLNRFGVKITPFDTCLVNRSSEGAGKLSCQNVKNAFFNITRMRTVIKRKKPDIIYVNSSMGNALLKDLLCIILGNKHKNAKVVLHIHFAEINDILPRNKFFKRLFFRWIRKYVDHVVLLSTKLKKTLIRYGIDEKKMSVIYNFHTINMKETDILNKIKTSKTKNSKDILFLGSLDKRKGIIDLLNAVSKTHMNVSLHIGGEAVDSTVMTKINELISAIGKEKVELLGYIDGEEKQYQLQQADILVLPSYGEGFPIVIPEAFASGCAVITSNVGAIPEIFKPQNGIMIHPGDIDELSKALLKLCDSESLYDTMLYNWKDSSKYSLDAFLLQMTRVCRDLC